MLQRAAICAITSILHKANERITISRSPITSPFAGLLWTAWPTQKIASSWELGLACTSCLTIQVTPIVADSSRATCGIRMSFPFIRLLHRNHLRICQAERVLDDGTVLPPQIVDTSSTPTGSPLQFFWWFFGYHASNEPMRQGHKKNLWVWLKDIGSLNISKKSNSKVLAEQMAPTTCCSLYLLHKHLVRGPSHDVSLNEPGANSLLSSKQRDSNETMRHSCTNPPIDKIWQDRQKNQSQQIWDACAQLMVICIRFLQHTLLIGWMLDGCDSPIPFFDHSTCVGGSCVSGQVVEARTRSRDLHRSPCFQRHKNDGWTWVNLGEPGSWWEPWWNLVNFGITGAKYIEWRFAFGNGSGASRKWSIYLANKKPS